MTHTWTMHTPQNLVPHLQYLVLRQHHDHQSKWQCFTRWTNLITREFTCSTVLRVQTSLSRSLARLSKMVYNLINSSETRCHCWGSEVCLAHLVFPCIIKVAKYESFIIWNWTVEDIVKLLRNTDPDSWHIHCSSVAEHYITAHFMSL